ncbi:unnamed protein product, partial [Musa textilis]
SESNLLDIAAQLRRRWAPTRRLRHSPRRRSTSGATVLERTSTTRRRASATGNPTSRAPTAVSLPNPSTPSTRHRRRPPRQGSRLHEPRLRLGHRLALPEDRHRLRLLGLRRLLRRPPRPRSLRRHPLLPRRHGGRRGRILVLLRLGAPGVARPAGLPLRRVHGRRRHAPDVPPLRPGHLDGTHLLRPALRHPGRHETVPPPPLPLRPPLRAGRHLGGHAGQQDGGQGHQGPGPTPGHRLQPAALHGAPPGGHHEGARPSLRLLQDPIPRGHGALPDGARHRRRGHLAGGVEDVLRDGRERGQEADHVRGDVPLADPGGAGGEQQPRPGGHEGMDRRARRAVRRRGGELRRRHPVTAADSCGSQYYRVHNIVSVVGSGLFVLRIVILHLISSGGRHHLSS